MKKVVFAMLFISLVFSFPVLVNSTSDDTQLIKDVSGLLYSRKGLLILDSYGSPGTTKYLLIEPNSVALANNEDISEISLSRAGDSFTTGYGPNPLFVAINAKDVWNTGNTARYFVKIYRRETGFDIDAVWDEGISNYYDVFDLNPSLSENPGVYFVLWDDGGNVPLRILAYRILGGKSLNIVLKNISKKVIVAFRFSVTASDIMGYPIKNYAGATRSTISVQSIFPPDSLSRRFSGWSIAPSETMWRANPQIDEILFEDGTTWKRR